ncbi:NADPH-dependent FMN reductase [Flavobacterium sp. ASW18X]|uniref:NADPH-dependent FMN reductase n=1 Tax=Flavobacterium sp. ASW18X TaxID=2572595 RepID=UPI0010ADE5AA|nr:NAD(P)H-dependent oxidoreductase [Flavobacterium sp. ASW18X]TKD65926.1 NAD(P)H-dependent oxidoreductase [Flavobacterium sp. ASW18X]
MANILAFAGSNSSKSINYQLVLYTVSQIENHQIQTLNLANYPFPMFSEDLEEKEGYSNSLIELKNDIQKVDALIISVNEHNGSMSAYFKNLLDWLSRVDRKFLANKKILLMATSTGQRGANGALTSVSALLPRFGAEVIATFSLPSFMANLSAEKGILDSHLEAEYNKALSSFLDSL